MRWLQFRLLSLCVAPVAVASCGGTHVFPELEIVEYDYENQLLDPQIKPGVVVAIITHPSQQIFPICTVEDYQGAPAIQGNAVEVSSDAKSSFSVRAEADWENVARVAPAVGTNSKRAVIATFSNWSMPAANAGQSRTNANCINLMNDFVDRHPIKGQDGVAFAIVTNSLVATYSIKQETSTNASVEANLDESIKAAGNLGFNLTFSSDKSSATASKDQTVKFNVDKLQLVPRQPQVNGNPKPGPSPSIGLTCGTMTPFAHIFADSDDGRRHEETHGTPTDLVLGKFTEAGPSYDWVNNGGAAAKATYKFGCSSLQANAKTAHADITFEGNAGGKCGRNGTNKGGGGHNDPKWATSLTLPSTRPSWAVSIKAHVAQHFVWKGSCEVSVDNGNRTVVWTNNTTDNQEQRATVPGIRLTPGVHSVLFECRGYDGGCTGGPEGTWNTGTDSIQLRVEVQ